MTRSEIRWTCDRCEAEVMMLATKEEPRPPSSWKRVEGIVSQKDLCGECLDELRSWWNESASEVRTRRALIADYQAEQAVKA